MPNITAISTCSYISFLVATGEDAPLGCNLPRSDASFFTEKLSYLLEEAEAGRDFPDCEYDTEFMSVSLMVAGDMTSLIFHNKVNGQKLNLSLENYLCHLLINKMKMAESNSNALNGPTPSQDSEVWNFFQITN
jgi:hypothetical protein